MYKRQFIIPFRVKVTTQVDLPYFVVFPDAICGVDLKRTGIKPFVSFVTLIFGEWMEKMAVIFPKRNLQI